MYIPDSKIIRIDGITCDKEDVYIWISLFKPTFEMLQGQRSLVVDYKIALLVKYNSQQKFTYYTIDPIIDHENKRPPTELSNNPASYYFEAPFGCTNTCIVDSMLYLGIYRDKEVKDRPDYPMVVYKFAQNRIRFVEFYKTELPKINSFENISNPFMPVSAGNSWVYFTCSPYYLNVTEQKFTIFSFLPKQDLKLSNPKSILWTIFFVVFKNNQTVVCVHDKITEQVYIIKLQDNYIIEKYRIRLPEFTSDFIIANENVICIDKKKEHILKIPLSQWW